MKTQSFNCLTNQFDAGITDTRLQGVITPNPAAIRRFVSSTLDSATRHLVRAVIATLVVVAIPITAIWASEALAASGIVQAIIWGSGFIFLALAVEANSDRFKPLLATGLSLGVLALLNSTGSVVFAFLAAILIAAWSAWAILQGWKE
jgi:hypothetical protein